MMGRGHATMGASFWLSGCAAAKALGAPVSASAVLVGAAVCAGAALLPDLDHPDSTVARSAGPLTHLLARKVAEFSAAVHGLTKTPADRACDSGHRTVTHTVVWAILMGLITVGTQWWAGPVVPAALVFLASHVGIQTVLPPPLRHHRVPTGLRMRWAAKRSVKKLLGPDGTRLVSNLRRFPVPVSVPCALALAFVVYRLSPEEAWWLGLAVGLGSLIHCLGDCLTHYACPILWPIALGRRGDRRRWKPIGPPPAWRFQTGGLIETKRVQPALILLGCVALTVIVWPGASLIFGAGA